MMLFSLSLGIFDYMFMMSHNISLVSSWNFMSFRSVKRTPVFLGAFAKLRKATFASLFPSVRMEQLVFHWMNFHEILYFRTFRKSVEKIQVPLKSDMNKEHFI